MKKYNIAIPSNSDVRIQLIFYVKHILCSQFALLMRLSNNSDTLTGRYSTTLFLWHYGLRYNGCCSSDTGLLQIRKIVVVRAPGMPGTFSPPPRDSDPDMHHVRAVMSAPECMPGSLTSGFLWSRWHGKRSWYSRSMHNPNPQFYVSGKRPMSFQNIVTIKPFYIGGLV